MTGTWSSITRCPLDAASQRERFEAVARSLRDLLTQRWLLTQETHDKENPKRVYYLSMEFLIGRTLVNNIINLGAEKFVQRRPPVRSAPGLDRKSSNGARCRPGQRRLGPARRLLHRVAGHAANPGHGLRPALRIRHFPAVDRKRFPGRTTGPLAGSARSLGSRPAAGNGGSPGRLLVRAGRRRCEAVPGRPTRLLGVPYDRPVVGYGGRTINTLRLWGASSPDYFDFGEFSSGDFVGAIVQRVVADTVTRVLYPDDSTQAGQALRFCQEYFLVCCSLADIVARFRRTNDDWRLLPEKVAIQLNDTHPAMAVAELMRILLDRGEARLGRGVGPDRSHAGLHESHAAARGAREMARPVLRAGLPAACWKSSTRSTAAF